MEIIVLENKGDSENDRVLRQKAKPVKDITGEVRKIAQEMIEAMHRGRGVGLAGPQVGFLRRIFVTHAEGDHPRVFIDPSIVWTSQEQVNYEEGCLSLPGIWAHVTRPGKIKIQAWNEKGRAFTLEAQGILARVILHEYDHLEGILFIDRLDEARRSKVLSKLEKQKKAG
ncbi:MAG: peptide deformylase [Spirochaetaceae bacterium]|jgi:peptide deformylase|nr:peptide deformylase [Spirochaetaceae bacterium]